MPPTIRDAAASDEPGWRPLWEAYNRFYGQTLPDAVTLATWRKILDPAASAFARVAMQEGAIAGFCICVVHECTWTLAPVCYLEDLFVDAAQRGHGLGRALIEDVIGLARARGFSRVYWHTRTDNAAARRLYETFVPPDDFVRYTLPMG